ncbi:putative short-chain dehydrogenase [Phaeomoniella chlamydospora]|uniref:Putative short-chain dehydrogenase n=1 Tax=Phaeomoniella chlamydospora TaxID=158046 RepID=A0A0G2H151_PHACM|nr:putative short-chain dehydrogenase [Phaeomoniella chlamydospora]
MAIKLVEGKVTAVTGGLTGIGRAIALAFLTHGAYVAVNHLGGPGDGPHLKSLLEEAQKITGSTEKSSVKEKRIITVAGDVSDPKTGETLIGETVKAFGRLDVFVSNAGICQFEEFLKVSPTLLNSHISTNLAGAYLTTQSAARQLASQNPPGGSLILISSISALVGGAGQTHYTPTKAGILSLSNSLACALGQYNIRANALLPGTIRTQLNDEDLEDEEKRTYMEGRIPLGRLGQPLDLAGPALFLACEELSGYVTGAQILVDGGAFVNFQ